MVTFNIFTDLHMEDGSHGHTDEPYQTPVTLDGLDAGVLPVAPLTRTFTIITVNGQTTTVSMQTQTIEH
ncbi:hypothetical protein SCLCIDRAFT_1225460 [Scleroderma citrinum Foug A]|uniref:Uncharacterized protein n=1 Tax=Scleroderma citrinum Foug A TaxID=1036808 RepID=A0A0C2YKG3_9AGAM|nr:hypothetical protein SCLCIDRAFT_1225460 [Scleroderma citrinum Foug A]